MAVPAVHMNIADVFADIMSDDEEVIGIIERPRRPRIFRDRTHHFEMWDEHEFLNRFRLSKHTIITLLQQIGNRIGHATRRNHAIDPLRQLLVALRFFASGSMLITIGDFGGIHKSTVSRIILRVATVLASLAPQYIKLPQEENEISASKALFYQTARFPRVIGAVDCTHVRLQSPGGDTAEQYRNRKGFFSLNVQVVSDAKLKITNVVARWPGSTHGATIFNNSRLRAQFETGTYGDSLLLGDSGYGIRPYLMTPLLAPGTRAEVLYNESQIRTRNVVERLFGVWKRRFPILSLGIRMKLTTARIIIVACAVLHNIARDMNDPEPDINFVEQEIVLPIGEEAIVNEEGNANRGGNIMRQILIHDYFANLL